MPLTLNVCKNKQEHFVTEDLMLAKWNCILS